MPLMSTRSACIYTPAIAGPIAPPIRLRRTVVPKDTPANCLGVDCKTISKPPTCTNDRPVAIIAKVTDVKVSNEIKVC